MRKTLVILAGIIFFATSSAHAQSTFSTFQGGPIFEVGQGVNSATSEGLSVCVADKTFDAKPSGLSQTIDVNLITSSHQMTSALDVGAYAAYFGGFSNFTMRSRFTENESQARERVSFYMKVSVRGVSHLLRTAQPHNDVATALRNGGFAEFVKSCGDAYVERIESGGEFLVIVNHDRSDTSRAKQFQLDIRAAVGTGEARADVQNRIQETSRELNVTVHLAQLGLGSKSAPSLVDVQQLMDHGRTFAAAIASAAATDTLVPYRIHLRKYTQSIAFNNLFFDTSKERMINFDPSIEILRDLVESYDLTYQRLTLLRQALRFPQSFKRIQNAGAIYELEKKFVAKANEIGAIAKACAELTRAAKACEHVAVEVPQIPIELVRLPTCDAPTEAQRLNGCARTALSNEVCVCTACEFQKTARQILKATPAVYACRGLPPGKRFSASFDANLTHPRNISVWYILQFSVLNNAKRAIIETPQNGASGAASHAVQHRIEGVVPNDGEISLRTQMVLCQPNYHEDWDRCTVTPLTQGKSIWSVNVLD